MATLPVELFDRDDISDDVLHDAARLFSHHYGVWGAQAAVSATGLSVKAGDRVTMSPRRLKAECMPANADCSYARITVDGDLGGHAITCRWQYEEKTVCWVTQLVVHRDFRQRGLATALLAALRRSTDGIFGIASSHPAAILTAMKAFRSDIDVHDVSLRFILAHSRQILADSPVPYLRTATARGQLFELTMGGGNVSTVDTGFFVDHEEPSRVLDVVRRDRKWPLGDLPEGHEFLLVLQRSLQEEKGHSIFHKRLSNEGSMLSSA